MSVLDVVHYGDPILKKKSKSVTDFKNIESIINDMFDSMYEAEGIGLAANQIGIDLHIFIVDISHTEETDQTHIFINSKIINNDYEEEYFQEGCLSLPGIALDVLRPKSITLKYQTPDQKWHEKKYNGLLARAIQHEIDHLNGVFIIDRIDQKERKKYKNDLRLIATTQAKNRAKKHKKEKGFFL
jgi:peptide deformylase